MTEIADLAPCNYFPVSEPHSLVAVGWLSVSSTYTSGAISDEFLERLAVLIQRPWQPPFVTGGIHLCELCHQGVVHCHSDLVMQDDPNWSNSHDASVRCLACGERIDGQAAMERALDLHFELESYLAAKDGADAPLDTCPECGVDAYIMSEEEVGCANCGLVLGECGRCHTGLVPSNVDPDSHGLCSYCGHLFSKDD